MKRPLFSRFALPGLVFGLLSFVPTALMAQERPTESAEEQEEEPQPPIEYKWFNFGLLAVGLGYLVIKQGLPALTERGREIEKALKAAEIIKADAAAEEAAIDKKMAGMKAAIDSMRAAAKNEMEAERARMTAETQSLVTKLQANAESEIATMTKQAQGALSARASELALALARQKVATRMDSATDAGLITGFVQDLKKLASSAEVRN